MVGTVSVMTTSDVEREPDRVPRVVIVHDYLTQRGGAERVVLSMLRAFPQALVVTSVYNAESTFDEFRVHDVRTTWLRRVPLARRDPRLALPLLASAFSSYSLPPADVVLCSSSGWAHGVRTKAPKVVYCHNPPRWLHQTSEYAGPQPLPARLGLELLRRRLTDWDRQAATGATTYLANSTTVRDRIMRTYGLEAEVVPPPVGIRTDGPQDPVPGLEPGFLLSVSRARGYKNLEILARTVESIPGARIFMVGGVPERTDSGEWSERVSGGCDLPDAQLRWLYANCAGLVAVSHEDFGLTPLEANAFGKPVACLRAGGYLDSVLPGVNGVFIDHLTAPAIAAGVKELLNAPFDPDAVVRHARTFGDDVFGARMRRIVQAVAFGSDHGSRDITSAEEHVSLPREQSVDLVGRQ